jgi:hypothetical protein
MREETVSIRVEDSKGQDREERRWKCEHKKVGKCRMSCYVVVSRAERFTIDAQKWLIIVAR